MLMSNKTPKLARLSDKGYRIAKKRSGRYIVYKRGRKTVNGEAKVAILAAEGLIKVMKAKAKAS
jgi:hypothetical protein